MGTASSIQGIKYKDQEFSLSQIISQDIKHNTDTSQVESIFFFVNNQYDIGETFFHNLNSSFI